MPRNHHQESGTPLAQRATRCQLLWAAAFLIGVSATGWYAIARLWL